MTASDVPTPNASAEPATLPDILLGLQAVDTRADQLGRRRERSPLRDDFVAATTQMRAWELRRDSLRSQIDRLGVSIEEAEQRGAKLQTNRERLERQMKTVIAPREAEALMHELATISGQVDDLDLEELEALEQQSAVDDQLSVHLTTEEQQRTHLQLADEALGSDVADIDHELTDLAARRSDLRGQLADAMLATYDRKRAAFGVAVARLVGKQCQGCHLELSAAEVDTVKSEAADTGVTDCPDCGRLLIV